ncbi:30S ribosomal protein S6 [Dethiothermospora halolimnae]|uniref:30S ribosomal protein S6 n=1 Tax=Dethiothermospora halolimnae TaxID=3114390 RepID=UPI003CCBE1C1
MRKYEAMFIFTPELEEEKRNSVFDKMKGIIESNGSIEDIDEWGMRKLAYEINDYKEGYYIVVNFESEKEVIDEMERVSRITDEIIRHMVIKDEQ